MTTTFSFEFDAMTPCPFVAYRGHELVEDDVISRFDSGTDLREFLAENGVGDDDEILMHDADGNGSDCVIPVAWIGDGEKLFMSRRVLGLIEKGLK